MTVDTQLELDLTRPDRSAENIERSLREMNRGPVQIAVLQQLCIHPRVAVDPADRLPTLKISQSQAADWIRRHVPCAGGKCDPTSVRQAWQFWRDQGVLIVVATKSGTTIKWHPKRLMAWYEKEATEELPLFEPIGGSQLHESGHDRSGSPVTGDDRSRLPVTGDDRSRSVMIGQDSLRRSEEDNNSLLHPHSEEPVAELPNVSEAVRHLVNDLPELPVEVWDEKRSDSALFLTVTTWWTDNGLADKCGDLSKEVTATVAGLILASRRANSPPAYFATCIRKGVRHHVTTQGRAWINQQKRQRAPVG